MYSSAEIAGLINSYVSLIGNSLNNPENPVPREEEAGLRWWNQRERIKKPLQEVSLRQLIDAIGEFPVAPLVLDMDTTPGNIRYICRVIKTQSQALSWFLKPLILGEPFPANTPFNAWSYHGLAQLSKARFNLATETYIRSPDLQGFFPSAAVLWVCCECSDSRDKFERSGVIGEPTILGKTSYLKHQTKVIQDYMKFEIETKFGPPGFDWRLYLPNLLYREAYKIAAQTDEGYFGEHYYRPFWRLWQRFNNVVVKRDNVQGFYALPDGSIFVTGRHNKIPKGFQPKQSSTWGPTKTKRQPKV